MRTLDEAIKACERVCEDCEKFDIRNSELYKNNKMLANWLKELKEYKRLEGVAE